LVVISLAVWSIITACTALVTTVNQLLLTRVLLGLAEALYLPAAIALIADHHEPGSRASAIGVHTAGLSAGLVGGGTLSGYLGEYYGWRVPFVTLGAAGIILAIACALWLRDGASERPVPKGSPVRGFGDLFAIPSIALLVSAAMFSAAGMNMFTNWLPLYFRESYGLSLASAGFSGTFLVQFSGVLGALAGGFASDRAARVSKRRRMLLHSAAFALSAPALMLFLWHPALAILAACIFVFGLMRAAGVANESPLLCDLLEPRQRSSAMTA
jgi:predicted MFS family arabinose efflux permease